MDLVRESINHTPKTGASLRHRGGLGGVTGHPIPPPSFSTSYKVGTEKGLPNRTNHGIGDFLDRTLTPRHSPGVKGGPPSRLCKRVYHRSSAGGGGRGRGGRPSSGPGRHQVQSPRRRRTHTDEKASRATTVDLFGLT